MNNWSFFTYCFVFVAAIAYIIFFIVITIGGFFDLAYLFKCLKSEIVDNDDDGRARVITKNMPDNTETGNKKSI